jgi:hypothetical protein
MLRRYPGYGRDGCLEAVFICMMNKRYYVQVPFNWTDEWKHIGLVWHRKKRRLELYMNGELAGRADPGKEEWLTSPWNPGGPCRTANGGFSFGSSDHGGATVQRHLKDEAHVYYRALTAEEIRENYGRNAARVKK